MVSDHGKDDSNDGGKLNAVVTPQKQKVNVNQDIQNNVTDKKVDKPPFMEGTNVYGGGDKVPQSQEEVDHIGDGIDDDNNNGDDDENENAKKMPAIDHDNENAKVTEKKKPLVDPQFVYSVVSGGLFAYVKFYDTTSDFTYTEKKVNSVCYYVMSRLEEDVIPDHLTRPQYWSLLSRKIKTSIARTRSNKTRALNILFIVCYFLFV